jgi:ParB family chromosome partitioning protein
MSASKNLERLLGLKITSDAAPAGPAVGTAALASARVIPIDRIVADPRQPRRQFDTEEMNLLSGSLRELGQTDPVKVRWDAAQDRYVLIDGERRWRAAQSIGLTTLNAIVDNRDIAGGRLLELQVVENAVRQDLSTMEAGEAYQSLMRTWGCTQQQLAARLNVSQSKVSRALAALGLPDDVRRAISAGEVAPIAAVKKARSESGRRKPSKPKSYRLTTDAGVAVVTPKPGRTVADVLAALLDAERRKSAA